MCAHPQDIEGAGESPKGKLSPRTTSRDSADSGRNSTRRTSRSVDNGALDDKFQKFQDVQDAGSKTEVETGGVDEQGKKPAGLEDSVLDEMHGNAGGGGAQDLSPPKQQANHRFLEVLLVY